MAIIDRVKYDGPDNVFVWRWPHDEGLTWGTQLIVNQTQEALFFKGGKALDLLGPGRHTLKSANIPLLEKIINLPFGSQTPFASEIYFINKAVTMDMKWGTREPIPILEPVYKMFIPVRAFGQFGMKVKDSRKLITELVGTEMVFDSAKILDYFRGHLMSRIKDYISETIIHKKISVLTISTELNEMSEALKKNISDEFERFGIEIVNFYLSSVNVPQDDESVKKLKEILAKKAEYDIMGDQQYKTVKTFDVAEKAAQNEGMGGLAGAGVGMGVGLGLGAGMGQMTQNAMNPAMQPAPPAAGQVACASCKGAAPQGAKFCPHCGKPMTQTGGFCTNCGKEKPAGAKFCPHCGKQA